MDLVIRSARVAGVDRPVDIGVRGERIARVGPSLPDRGALEIEAEGRLVTPALAYQTRDGYVYLAVGSDRQWAALTGAPPLGALARPEYAANAGRIADVEALNRELARSFAPLPSDEVFRACHQAGVPIARVHTLAEVVTDPLAEPGIVRITDPRSGLTVALPVPPHGAPPRLRFPPRLGEHNAAVLGEALGYDAAQLAELRERGVI